MGNVNYAIVVPVALKVFASPLNLGGFGIKNLSNFNDDLLSKLAWKTVLISPLCMVS